jgi:hypothetical protein
MMPVVINAMGIFPSVVFGVSTFNPTSNPTDLINFIFPTHTFINIFGGDIYIAEFTVVTITALFVAYGLTFSIITKSFMPLIIGIVGFMMFPVLLDVAAMIYGSAQPYGSNSLMLFITTIIAGFIVLGIITLLEITSQGDVSDS